MIQSKNLNQSKKNVIEKKSFDKKNLKNSIKKATRKFAMRAAETIMLNLRTNLLRKCSCKKVFRKIYAVLKKKLNEIFENKNLKNATLYFANMFCVK